MVATLEKTFSSEFDHMFLLCYLFSDDLWSRGSQKNVLVL